MDGPWADSSSLSCCISTLIAARSASFAATMAWKAEAGTTSAEAPVVGVDGVVGDDTDEEVVCDEVDGDVVPEEEVVAALDPGEAAGAVGWLLAPLPPFLPLLGFALPPVPSGLVWVGMATNTVAACSPCLNAQLCRLQLPARNLSHCGSLLMSPCSEGG